MGPRTSKTPARAANRAFAAGSIALILLLVGLAAPLAQPADLRGLWLTDTRDGIVEFRPCGAEFCGFIYEIRDASVPADAHDIRNEKAELRHRPICGLQVMGKLKKLGDARWGEGWVYDPKVGQTYSLEVQLKEPNTLTLHGYVGIKLAGRTVTWTRASGARRCTPPPRAARSG